METNNGHLKQLLLRCLRPGRESAITGKRLAQLLGERSDRRIRMLIRELIADGVPIASATELPAGFYIASSQAEVEGYAQSLRARLVEMHWRRRDFLRSARAIMRPQQLELPIGR